MHDDVIRERSRAEHGCTCDGCLNIIREEISRLIYMDPEGEKCHILLKGNGLAMVEYRSGYMRFWLLGSLKPSNGPGSVFIRHGPMV